METAIWQAYQEYGVLMLGIVNTSNQNSIDNFGNFTLNNSSIPIYGVAGDQQAALFGQSCTKKGNSKCTYGTGLFYLQNVGNERLDSKNNLISTIAINNKGRENVNIFNSIWNFFNFLYTTSIINKLLSYFICP